MIAVHPGGLHLHGSLVHEDALQPAGLAGERQGGQFSFISARAQQTGDGDELQVRSQDYSRISSVNRRFNFIPAAPSSVRMDRAVRPCLPMTLPRSLAATFSSNTVTCSPCTSLTITSSGKSTRAFAMSSTSCFMPDVSLALHQSSRGVLPGVFPGRPAGFSCTRSRKRPLSPVASETLSSPNLSRILSTADMALRQRLVDSSSSMLSCPPVALRPEAWTPKRRMVEFGLRLARNRARTCWNIS